MSRIKWERARKLLSWQFAEPPETWPVRFTPYQLARLQAHAGLDVDRSADAEISALKKAIEAAVKAVEIPHIVEKFSFPSRVMSWGGTKELNSQELPAIAASDFARWLEGQGEASSVHISAWFAAYHTAPATDTATSAPVAEGALGGVVTDKAGPVDETPWLVVDPKDPIAEHHWYTPARYFARQLVRSDSTLLNKKLALADKVSQSLYSVGIYKRGGKKRHAADTVLKAFSNVTWG